MFERVGPLVAAVLVVVGLVLVLPDDEPPAPDEDPVPAFLAAYERSRTVELVVESTFTRTVADGRELRYEQRIVQRPPDDRLVIGAGSATGRIGGRIVRCTVVAEGAPTCVQGAAAPPYAEEVAAELSALRALVEGAARPYDVDAVEAADGEVLSACFALELQAAMLSPPYGTAARFCFDTATGALADVEVVRDESTDRTVADEIRTEVT
ncbi:MAG TPA: hypothetical protein VFG94_02555, partial [Acidimicrobiales bacterium]|nr:hypothetical protein [Acidimicrobiales bacterium]